MDAYKMLLCAVCAVVVFAAHATLPEPVEGVITITEDVTVSSSADAATLAAATGLVLSEGKTLTYTCADALTLNATVSGSGKFVATSAGKVTLNGDNALTAPGSFKFTNTPLHLGHFNALGGAAAGMAEYDKTAGLITFTYVNNCFTNNTPLNLTKAASQLGSDAVSRYFVQNADLTFSNQFSFQNNFEMCHGTLNSTGGTPYWYHTTETGGKVKLTGDTVTVCTGGRQIIYFSTGLQIGGTSYRASGGLATDSSRNITCMKDYVLTADTYFAPYAQASASSTSAYYNLNGHSQNIAYLGASSSGNFAPVRSAAGPCTLATVTTATGTQYAPFVFHDAISYSNGCNKVHQFKARHPSTGDLWVTKGGVTFLANGTSGGGWAGKKVTVSGTGVLDCQSSVSLTSGLHDLVVTDGGTLRISAGVRLDVGTATFGSVKLEPDTTYTVAEIQALVAGEGVTVEGEGSIKTSPKSVPGVWNGWPTDPTVTAWQVPDGANAVITEADIPKVEQLEEIETGLGATITFAVAGKTLTLKAALSGAATFKATGAGKLILTGDNSNLRSPGHIEVLDTPVEVRHFNGFGGPKTGQSKVYRASSAITTANLTFVANEAGVFTNNAPLLVQSTTTYIGMPTAGERFVQNADLTVSASSVNNILYGANAFEMCHGKFIYGGNVRWYPTCMEFTGDCTMTVGSSGSQAIVYASGLRIACASCDIPGGIAPDRSANIIFDKDYVLTEQTYFRPYAQGSGGKWFNLNGHNQNISHLECLQATGYATILSDGGPCTLKTVTTSTPAELNAPFVFLNDVSYWQDSVKTQKFTGRSTSTGDLKVTKGGVTFLASGAVDGGGWAGANVTVGGTGVLDCQSPVSLNTGRHLLVVESGGTLNIAEGVTLKVATATFGSVALEPATVYAADEVRALLDPNDNVTVTGNGVIQTATTPVPGEWTGWPEVGTATTWQVPDDAIAVITADDIAKVEALSEITTGLGAEIRFAVDGATLNLNAKLTGGALVRVTNAGTLVINGDNSGLVAPGGFRIEGTTTIVSNRFGLGTAKAAPAQFWPKTPYASNMSTLWFGGDATTNDVELAVNYGLYIGHQDPDVSFVQTANISQPTGGDTGANNRIYFRNRFAFADGTVAAIAGLGVSLGGTLRIEEGATTSQRGLFGNGTLEVAGTMTGELAIEQGVQLLRCERENCLSNLTDISLYDSSMKTFVLDLNGFSQTVKKLRGRGYYNANQQPFDVTSAEPATLTLNCSQVQDSEKKPVYIGSALRILGQASLVKDNVSTQLVGCMTSTTTGSLTINDGAIRFEREAKWVGGDVILNGGALIVAESAGTDTFNRAGRRPEVELEVNGGTLHLTTAACVPSVSRAKVGGEYLPRGTYTKANCAWITGEGSLTVRHGASAGAVIFLR